MKEEIRNEIVEQDIASAMEKFPSQQVNLKLNPSARLKLKVLSTICGMSMSATVTQLIDHSWEEVATEENEFSPKDTRELRTTMDRISSVLLRNLERKK